MKKFMVVMAAFVMAAGMSVVSIASDVPPRNRPWSPRIRRARRLGEVSGPIETGALPARSESSKAEASDSDADALQRSLEPENYVGHPDAH